MRLRIIKEETIAIYENEQKQKIINARELQRNLENKTRFSDWIRTRTEEFVENKDYFKILTVEKFGGTVSRTLNEYYITVDMAQRICMTSKSKICKKIQSEIIKNKDKSFLEILESVINHEKEDSREKEIIEISIEDKEYPQNLRKIKNPPLKIYARGNINLLNELGIAVIGSRTTSIYGKKMCKVFVNNLVGYNLNIISGLASGMDSAAHKNCIEAGGKTIAVLPCGLKHIYPKSNEELYNKILETEGLILTEYEPNEKESQEHFRERNRIVAGLGIGTLVIESHRVSGTSITVRNTAEQDKKSFCIPSSLENQKGLGNNEMIRDKRAKLVMTVEDIIEEYPNLNLCRKENFKFLEIKEEKNKKIKEKHTNININVSKENLEVYNALSKEPQTINELSIKIGKPINEISYKLTMLQLENAIEELPGKKFIRK